MFKVKNKNNRKRCEICSKLTNNNSRTTPLAAGTYACRQGCMHKIKKKLKKNTKDSFQSLFLHNGYQFWAHKNF